MRSHLIALWAGAAAFLTVATAATAATQIYVDAAPNAYGSPAYGPWRTAAMAAAAQGTFVNMANGWKDCNVGSTRFEIEDEVVYSFGDLGKRLTWVYWIPGETTASLAGRIDVQLINVWDGEMTDFYEYYYGSSWLTPGTLIDYDANGDTLVDGVIGMAGMAWWGAYGLNTPEALETDLAAWGAAEESWQFSVRIDGIVTSLASHRVPFRIEEICVGEIIDRCASGAKNHGQYVSAVAKELNAAKKSGLISGAEKDAIQSYAAQLDLP